MQIVWTAAALRDLAEIREYISADNPTAADRQVQRVLEAVARLETFPEMAREGRIAGTRELVVSRTPYLVPYRLRGDTIQIARILHARQSWPKRL